MALVLALLALHSLLLALLVRSTRALLVRLRRHRPRRPPDPGVALPPCTAWPGVSEEAREALLELVSAMPSSLRPACAVHHGLLALGVARGIGMAPSQRERLTLQFEATLRWREAENVDRLLAEGLPPPLARVQVPSGEYGQAASGQPVVIESVVDWETAVEDAIAFGLSPEQFGRTRVAWSEGLLARAAQLHLAGEGNGQTLYVADLHGSRMSVATLQRNWPYMMAAVRAVQRFGGTTQTILVTRPPWLFRLGWAGVRKVLRAETLRKIAVVPGDPPHLKAHGVELPPHALPRFLGGGANAPARPHTYPPIPPYVKPGS